MFNSFNIGAGTENRSKKQQFTCAQPRATRRRGAYWTVVFNKKILACPFGTDLGHIPLFGAYLSEFLKFSWQWHCRKDPGRIGGALAGSATFQDSLQTVGAKSLIQRVD